MELTMLKLEAEIVDFRATVETARSENARGGWLANWEERFNEHRMRIDYLIRRIEAATGGGEGE